MSTIDDTAGSDLGLKFISDRRANDQKLKSRFEHIFRKYERDFTDIGDEINLTTGEVVVNNGHLQSMQNEADTGQIVTSSFIDDPETGDEAGTQDDTPDLEEDGDDDDDDDEESDFERSLHDLGIQIDRLSDGSDFGDDDSDSDGLAASVIAPSSTTAQTKRPIQRPAVQSVPLSNNDTLTDGDASHIRILDKLPGILKSSVLAMKPDGVEMTSESLHKLETNITSQIAQFLANSGSANIGRKESSTTREAAWQYPDLPELPPMKRQKLMSPTPARLALPSSAALFTRSPTSQRSLWAPSKTRKWAPLRNIMPPQSQLSAMEEGSQSEEDSEGDLPVLSKGSEYYHNRSQQFTSDRVRDKAIATPSAPQKMSYAANTGRRMTSKTDKNNETGMSHLEFLNRYYPTERQHEREEALAARHFTKLKESTDIADAVTLNVIQQLGSDGETLNRMQKEFIRTVAMQSQQIVAYVSHKSWTPNEDVLLYELRHLQGKDFAEMTDSFPDRSKGAMRSRVKYIEQVIVPRIESESGNLANSTDSNEASKERQLWRDMTDAAAAKEAFREMLRREMLQKTPEAEEESSLFIPEDETPSDRQEVVVQDEEEDEAEDAEPQPYRFTVHDDRIIKRMRERTGMMFDEIAKRFPQSNAADIADRYVNRLHGKPIPKDLPPQAYLPMHVAKKTKQPRRNATSRPAEGSHAATVERPHVTTVTEDPVARGQLPQPMVSSLADQRQLGFPYSAPVALQTAENSVPPDVAAPQPFSQRNAATTNALYYPMVARPVESTQPSILPPGHAKDFRPVIARQHPGPPTTTDMMFSFRSDALIKSGAPRSKPVLLHDPKAAVDPNQAQRQIAEQRKTSTTGATRRNDVVILDSPESDQRPVPVETDISSEHAGQDDFEAEIDEGFDNPVYDLPLPQKDHNVQRQTELPACVTPPRQLSPQPVSSPPMPTTVYGTPNRWKQTTAPYFGALDNHSAHSTGLVHLHASAPITNPSLTTSRLFCPRMGSSKTPERSQEVRTHRTLLLQQEPSSPVNDHSKHVGGEKAPTTAEPKNKPTLADPVAPELRQTESIIERYEDYHNDDDNDDWHTAIPNIAAAPPSRPPPKKSPGSSKPSSDPSDARQALLQVRGVARIKDSARAKQLRRVVLDSDDSEPDYSVKERAKSRQSFREPSSETEQVVEATRSRRPTVLHIIGSDSDDSESDFAPEEEEQAEASADEQEISVKESVRMPDGRVIHLQGSGPTEVEEDTESKYGSSRIVGSRELEALLEPRFSYTRSKPQSVKLSRALTSSKTVHNMRRSLPATSTNGISNGSGKSRIAQLRSESKAPSRRHSSPALSQASSLKRTVSQSSRSSVVRDPSLASSKIDVDQLSEDELA